LNEAKALQISEQRPPPGYEYINGIAYWLALGDHFYLIQSQSVQTPALEEYLNWLLREKCGLLGSDHSVVLESEFDREQIGEDLDEIQSIQVGGLVPNAQAELVDEDSSEAIEDVVEHTSLGDRVGASWGKARKIVYELLGEVAADRLMEQLPDQTSLQVKVDIGYRAKKRKVSKDFMKDIAAGLRNAPEGELKIVGKGGVIRGDDARLSLEMRVATMSESSSLLDLTDACEKMREVHRRFVYDGRVVD
jgi:hypothetical protein